MKIVNKNVRDMAEWMVGWYEYTAYTGGHLVCVKKKIDDDRNLNIQPK